MFCWEVVAKLVSEWWRKKLSLDHVLPKKLGPYMKDSLYNWQHEAPYNLRTLASFFLYLGNFCVNEFHHKQHIFRFCCLVSETLTLKTLKDRGVVLNSSTLKIMPVFWHDIQVPPEISASACFRSSLLILINCRSLPVLLDFILSTSAWLILLKSSSSLKSLIVTLTDTLLNTKNLLFEASVE